MQNRTKLKIIVVVELWLLWWPTSALRIPKRNPNSKSSLQILKVTPNSKSSLQILKVTPNSKSSLRIRPKSSLSGIDIKLFLISEYQVKTYFFLFLIMCKPNRI